MPYTSVDHLEQRFGARLLVQLTDRGSEASGMIDDQVVDEALANTDAVIDASLGLRYRLPLATVPALVADLALAIAIYKLHVFAPDDKIQRDYEQALKDLRDLGSGAKRLDVAGIEPDTSGASGVITSDRVPMLSADSLRGFI